MYCTLKVLIHLCVGNGFCCNAAVDVFDTFSEWPDPLWPAALQAPGFKGLTNFSFSEKKKIQ